MNDIQRRYSLVKMLSLFLVVITFVGLLATIFVPYSNNESNPNRWILPVLCGLALVVYSISYGLLWRWPNNSTILEISAHALVSGTLLVIIGAQFVNTNFIEIFLILPVLVVVASLPRPGTWFFLVVNGVALHLTILFNYGWPGSLSLLTNYFFAYVLICWGLLVFSARLDKSRQVAEEQTRQVNQLLATLNSSTEVGASLSHQLSSVTNELNITSRQQASSTQEQVAAVTEVTASLEELSETANQIAASASGAARSAQRTVEVAIAVKQGREESLTVADEGNAAVAQAVDSVSQVRNRIELMGQRLLNLTEQTRRVGSIIDIIDEIADETHLLALNASIEAAGNILGAAEAGGNTGRSSNRGERFGVIAQEIKNLSERSRESTEEVRQAITEMQGAVAAAVLVAEEGKKATSEALLRSQIAGAVINKLNDTIEGSSIRFDQILEASEEVKQRCDEISIATGQQRSANQQIVSTMRGVAEVARESAGIVSELSSKALKVNEQVEQLNAVLAVTGQKSDVVKRSSLVGAAS